MTKFRLGLIFILIFALALPVYADEPPQDPTITQLQLHTVQEFLTFAENCRLDSYSQNLSVTLEADISLEGIPFEAIPIFSGSFNGNGHTISGLSITADGSVQGLFRYLTVTAVVENLSVEGTVHPGGSRQHIGGIAGQNQGRIIDCSFSGSISGSDHIGGLVGSNTVTGIIENCQINGQLHGDHFVGGVAGTNNGVIRDCTNNALINTTPQQNNVELSDITMETLTNTEAPNTVTDIGGIAGTSSGVIRSCKNLGAVGYQHIGYNIGGIAGTQSGYISNCENLGRIQGRKEVGGIVGQMEPTFLTEYSQDTLQILDGQLSELSGLVNQASDKAQNNADQLGQQVATLQDQAQKAQDALDVLMPEDNQLPDPDTTLAALNTLSESLSGMSDTAKSITETVQNTATGLSTDLTRIAGQVRTMEKTVGAAADAMGGSFADVSDQDTAETLSGKVEKCTNQGAVLADLNVGGIVGAMAMENDLDVLEDWEQKGEESLNFQSQLRVVTLNCENRGSVTAKKQNAGGIVGWQPCGLVKACINVGTLECKDADYVGGIAGLSTGYLRSSYAKCRISGGTYVGGIAGSGQIVTDCLSLVMLAEGTEKLGAILGTSTRSDQESPICGNFYVYTGKDPGGIDGISYQEIAQALPAEEFLSLDTLPELFKTVTVRFVFEDGTATEIKLPTGTELKESRVPTVPEKEGYTGAWEGLDPTALTSAMFDQTFYTVYTSYSSVIASRQTREDGLPLLLLEGSFTDQATVDITPGTGAPPLSKNQQLLELWQIEASEPGTTGRLLVQQNPKDISLLVCNKDQQWRTVSFTAEGSYIVFPLAAEDQQLALVSVPKGYTLWIIGGVAAAAVLTVAVMIVLRRKIKNRTHT